ncbi:MAG: hypothetical protein OHK0047_17870 [Leptolyngbyaceae cyanobacterium]
MYSVYYTAHPNEVARVHQSFVSRRIRFGERINVQPVNAPAGHQSYNVVYQDFQALYYAQQALAEHGKQAWIQVMPPNGPQWVTLEQFVRQNG